MTEPRPRPRSLLFACGIFMLVSAVATLVAPRELWSHHTNANHFALLADAWHAGRLDLPGPPPRYTGNNDFALFEDRTFVVFPPFPALLLAPWVRAFGGADTMPDGLFFLLLAGAAPALLFLALEELVRSEYSQRSARENAVLALAFGFGSVYFFSAVQGTVWFAAHVVGAALAALYLLFAVRAQRPLLAGLALALGFATRTPLLFAAPLFVIEAWRSGDQAVRLRKLAWFALPIVAVLALSAWYNHARFHDPFEFGYRYLTVVWQQRIERWGLFSYHYLARNLGVLLTSLPWLPGARGAAFSINLHGLALWLTTPLYLLLPWPRRSCTLTKPLALCALAVALPSLFYQNSGWAQFGYRFSNDYAPFLFALFALGGRPLRGAVLALLLWALALNTFGALSFGRAEYARYYYADPTQRILYQPD